MLSYSFFDSGFFIPVYALLLIIFAYLGNILAKREHKVFGGERNYASQGLASGFYNFSFSAIHFYLIGNCKSFQGF
jgi:hypothetical protein